MAPSILDPGDNLFTTELRYPDLLTRTGAHTARITRTQLPEITEYTVGRLSPTALAI